MTDVSEEAVPAKVYELYLRSGRLAFQRCSDCAASIFYPRVLCPACGGASLEWKESGGHGTVYATTAVHRRNAKPYNVALIDLDEGFRMMSRVEGVPAEEVEVGTRVVLAVRNAEEVPTAVFVPENIPERGNR
jgi:uncharacterized OB-fold protein